MTLKQLLEFKFGAADPEVILEDPIFRNMKWDTKSVISMIAAAYTAGAENTLDRLNHHKVD